MKAFWLRIFSQCRLAACFMPLGAWAETITLQPVADTFLSSRNPGFNVGGQVFFDAGIIWVVTSAGVRLNTRLLDLRSQLVLGMALHPDFARNQLLYTYTSEATNGPADFQTGSSGNYGWNVREGTFWFDAATGNEVNAPVRSPPTGMVDPIAQYDQDDGLAVIGGYLYRGSAIPPLTGRYVFGDWGSFSAPSGAFGVSGSLSGIALLTVPQLLNVIDNNTYVNVHTTANASGEIRGQLMK